MNPSRQIRLCKRSSAQVIAAARPHQMDGWASSAAKALDDPDAPMFAVEDETGRIVGQAGLASWPRGHARASATIALFDPRDRGLGFGTQVMKALLAHAFTKLGVSVVRIRWNEVSPAVRRCYQKAGFVPAKRAEEGAVLMVARRETWLADHGSDCVSGDAGLDRFPMAVIPARSNET